MTDQTAQPINTFPAARFDFPKFIEALKARGRSDQEIGQLLAGAMKLTALDLYVAMMTNLTDADFEELDKLPDEEAVAKRAAEIFQERTGMTLDELAEEIQAGMYQAAQEAGK